MVVSRSELGNLPAPIGPLLRSMEERRWNRERETLWRGLGYHGSRHARTSTMGKPPHLLVVPHYGPGHHEWGPGQRNLYFEATEGAREFFPDLRVSVLAFTGEEDPVEWHAALVDRVRDDEVTHVLCHAETDPGCAPGDGDWTWDQAWRRLATETDAVLLGVLFGSAFRWITAGARRLARESDRFVLVDICMPMDGALVRGRSEVGPVNMPMSSSLLDAIDRRTEGLGKVHDVSFIGALYPHRVRLIDELRQAGLRVAVNPHRPDPTVDFTSSRTNQPRYLDYMAGLAQSEMTINFSRSSAGPYEQLKTRVIEASSVGCLVLTDDLDRTSRFWRPNEEFVPFRDVRELPSLVSSWLEDPDRLRSAQLRARTTARRLAVSSFWGGIEAGLERRKLPRLRPSYAAPAPS